MAGPKKIVEAEAFNTKTRKSPKSSWIDEQADEQD